MSELGKAGAIKPVIELTTGDVFENAIRAIGVFAACEWFGYLSDSEFTKDTIRVLVERTEQSEKDRELAASIAAIREQPMEAL
jgi:hypothetical protein